MINTIIEGDCLEKLKELETGSIDSIVTDPPYELGFMGKSWDSTGIANNVELWQECLRVLKPGGHLLAFSGTRTYHRMACAIEDAGFEVRDMIEWIYSTGFPKSLNIGKAVNSLETNEWSKIGKALDNIDQKSIMEIWKRDALFATIKLSKSIIEVGINTPKSFFVPDIAVLYHNPLNEQLSAIFAELKLSVLNHISEENEIIVQKNVGQITIPSLNLARYAVKLSQSLGVLSWSIFTAECDVKEWLNENTEVNHKVDEALKTLRGNKKYSNEEIISVLCVALTDILRLTILNQSKTFQNLDTNQKMECVSAISVIITEYTAENLISNTVAILKSKAVDKLRGNEREVVGERKQRANSENSNIKMNGCPSEVEIVTKGTSEWEGWGTALKPAHEPICMARKPLAEKTVAENCLKWGTGGINIDESRVEGKLDGDPTRFAKTDGGSFNKFSYAEPVVRSEGRFPANLIHDNSEEVRECFPNESERFFKSISTISDPIQEWAENEVAEHREEILEDLKKEYGFIKGKSIIYQAKASKSERNRGLDSIVLVDILRVWNENNTTKEEKLIRLMVTGISTQKVIAESGVQLKNANEWNTFLFGKHLMEKYQEDIKSITKTEINSITTSQTLNWLIHLLTNEYTVGVKSEMGNGGNLVENVENSNTLIITINEAMALALGVKDVVSGTQLKISVKEGSNIHSTVKPIALMEYLIKMVTKPGGIVLDPFAGSGSTLVAAKQNGFQYVGIERESEYIEIIQARLDMLQ